MRIKNITIKNYRSFDSNGADITLPDIKLPFSIVGYNNSGKSNFINAIASCLGAKSSADYLSENDFYCKDTSNEVLIKVQVDDPLKSSDAFNQIKEMPVFKLEAKVDEGVLTSTHYFCDENGKEIFNPRALKRSTKKNYSPQETDVLNSAQKQGSEPVWKWKTKTPIYFIDFCHIENQLKLSNYTLLGKIMQDVKRNFEANENVVKNKSGVVKAHVGKPRKKVFDNAMQYLEDFVLSTDNLESLIANIELVIKKQLEIEGKDLSLKFGFASADSFFNNLEFYLTDNPKKPQVPIDQMGRGFISLFIVALFRAIIDTDKGGNIFLLEEPETFLHEHFQEYFYKVLCELSKNNQVIYSTHSKKFIDIFKPETIIRIKSPEYLKSDLIYNDKPSIEFPESLNEMPLTDPADFPKYMRTLEPNLGNIIFSSKVIIVEGPHDLLAYKTALSSKINFGLNNIAIVCAWGKDTVKTIVQLCKLFEIPFFVIHDWDLADDDIDVSIQPNGGNLIYQALSSSDKAQFTKNHKILTITGSNYVHQNKRNLESVLNISDNNKGAVSVFEKLNNKTLENIVQEFPKLVGQNLITFLDIKLVPDKN
jgi:putative ATP-dependent endonuclease of OLD family